MSQEQKDLFFMRQALLQAETSFAKNEVPVGALIVLDNVVIGSGFNCPITACDPTAHAEIQALRAASAKGGNYRLAGATLYVTIEPCTMCLGAIVHARVARLVYGAAEPKAGRVCSHSLLQDACFNHVPEVKGGVLEKESRELIQKFFAERRAYKKALRT